MKRQKPPKDSRKHRDEPTFAKVSDDMRSMPGVDMASLRETYNVAHRIVRTALDSDSVDADGNVTTSPEQLALAAMLVRRMTPSAADAARISSPLDVGPNDLRTISACRDATVGVVTMALRGELGIGEAERLTKMIKSAAEMNFASDLDMARRLSDRLLEATNAMGLPGVEGGERLSWGRFSAPVEPVEDAEAVTPPKKSDTPWQ